MAENYWRKKESEQEFDPINSLLAELADPEAEEAEFRSDFFWQAYQEEDAKQLFC